MSVFGNDSGPDPARSTYPATSKEYTPRESQQPPSSAELHISEISDILQIPVPIPFRPGSVNAFRVPLDRGEWMLVDAGPDTPEAWKALDDAIGRSGGWSGVRLHVVTHMHIDHVGLAARVRQVADCPLVMGELDAERMANAADDPESEAEFRASQLRRAGAPAWVGEALEKLSATGRGLSAEIRATATAGPVRADLEGAPGWETLWTPGHTAGHISLFRKSDRTLIAGDTILPRISPTIGVNRQRDDPVGDYLGTLDDLIELGPETTLVGHREAVHGSTRAEELRTELIAEARRVQELVGRESQTAWQISVERYRGRDLPPAPQIQAMRECLAHLDRLRAIGAVSCNVTDDGTLHFSSS